MRWHDTPPPQGRTDDERADWTSWIGEGAMEVPQQASHGGPGGGMTADPMVQPVQTATKTGPLSKGPTREPRRRGGRYWDQTSDPFGVNHVYLQGLAAGQAVVRIVVTRPVRHHQQRR